MCLARELKSVEERKRTSFIEVLIANVYSVKNQILIAVGYKICLSTPYVAAGQFCAFDRLKLWKQMKLLNII